MIERELSQLLQSLLDRTEEATLRANAARRLAESDAQAALDALVQVAQEDKADDFVSRAVGEAVARVVIRKGAVDQVPLHDFAGGAFLAYDETVARHLKRSAGGRPHK